MKDDFQFDYSDFQRALNDLVLCLDKDAGAVLHQQAGLLVKQMADITPPLSSKGEGLSTVSRGIRKVFGTWREMYPSIEKSDPLLAAAYWRAVKKENKAEAVKIAR